MENALMTKEEAIALAKKALKDIGHWESFKIENGRFGEPTPPYDYNFWLISFNFTEDDYNQGLITPMIIVNDEEQLVTFVSWKKSSFLLDYNEEEDKYTHPTLSREQKEFEEE